MVNREINKFVEEIGLWIIEHRRDIHQNPELSTKEKRTSEKVISVLKNLGIEVKTGYYNTGVVGIIRGESKGPTIAIRFDMDALKIDEKTNLPFTSKKPGIMHACGHDGHTAMGLGCAKALMQMKKDISGNIKLIFQPAEEYAPNGSGAQHMIKDHVLENPKVDAIFGMHIWPNLKLGTVGTKIGPIMASTDSFRIEVRGKGVHAAMPNLGIDSILIAAQIVNNLHTIVSRNIDPFEQAVVSIGKISGGTASNIIPEKVTIEGTVRTFNQEVREKIFNRIKTIVEKTGEAMGGEAELFYRFIHGPTINNEKMVQIAKQSIEEIIGENCYIEVDKPAFTGEDFSFFAQEVPAVYMWLGCKKDEEETHPLHSQYFNFDEKVLIIGTKVLVGMALNFSKQF